MIKQTYLAYDGIKYKIGTSKDSIKRIEGCKTANPNIELIAYGFGLSERSLHNRFEEKRLDREWFDLNDEDVEFIKNGLKNPHHIIMEETSLLKKARLKAGISQVDLAKELGLSRGTVVNYENGNVIPESRKGVVDDFINKHLDLGYKVNSGKDDLLSYDISAEDLIEYINCNMDELMESLFFRTYIENIAYKQMMKNLNFLTNNSI